MPAYVPIARLVAYQDAGDGGDVCGTYRYIHVSCRIYLSPLLSVGDEVVRIWQARVAHLTQARHVIGTEYPISATEIGVKVLDGACSNYARACVC